MRFDYEQLAEDLLSGDLHRAWNTILFYHEAGIDRLYICQELITKAMQHIGALWERAQITVADEHLATGLCDLLLTQVDLLPPVSPVPAPDAAKALFFCVENEQHYLGLKMVSQLFAKEGFQTRCLGPDLPLEFALTHAAKWKPDVIGLSAALGWHGPAIGRYLDALQKLPWQPLILIGGRITSQLEVAAGRPANIVILQELVQVSNWLDAYQAERSQIGRLQHARS